jgi:hypothetical protein
MARSITRRQILGAGAALVLASPAVAAPRAGKPETLTGKVRPVAELAAAMGARLDADAAPHWLALVTDDGKVYPLLKDGGSRLFFLDKALLNRPMRLTARFLPGSQLLQVLEVHSLIKGVEHEVYYWCNVCSIRRGEKMICECCGGPMILKEVPLKK